MILIFDDVKWFGGKVMKLIEVWIVSMEVVVVFGIKIICYNFMLVVDWCCIDFEWELLNGVCVMCFD